jgi:RHS repeat-associated protein
VLDYQYNKTSTIASVVGQINQASVNEQYRYDALQRLTNATVTSNGATTTLWYMYDNLGNRIYQKLNGVLTNFTYNGSNDELVKSCIVQSPTTCSTSTAYSYDFDGNLLTKNVTSTGTQHWYYTWDARGNLLQVKNGTVLSGYYAYDVQGRRVESWEGSFLFYAYMGTDTLAEQNIYGVATDHIFANGFISTDGQYIGKSYYHTDALGSVRLGTDTNANVIFSDSYQPYGQDNGTPVGGQTYKFIGKPYSSATGLYYYFQRWYDPCAGRFISVDGGPGDLSEPQSWNRYSYALNNPSTYLDPDGRSPINAFLMQIGRGIISTVFPSSLIGTKVTLEGKWMSMKWGLPNLPDPVHSIFVIRDNSKEGKASQYLKLDIESSGYQLVGWDSTAGKMGHGEFIDPRLGAGLETFGELAHFGRILLPIGIGVSGYNIYNALSRDLSSGQGFRNTILVGSQEGGGWAGAVIGAEAFGEAGAEFGAVLAGPLGAAIGGAVGAVTGGILGSIYGQQVGGWVGNQLLLIGSNIAPGWIYYPTPVYGKGMANPI